MLLSPQQQNKWALPRASRLARQLGAFIAKDSVAMPGCEDFAAQRVEHPQCLKPGRVHRAAKQSFVVEARGRVSSAFVEQGVDRQIVTAKALDRGRPLCIELAELHTGHLGFRRRLCCSPLRHAQPNQCRQCDREACHEREENHDARAEPVHGGATPPRTRSSRAGRGDSVEPLSPSSSNCSMRNRFGSATSGDLATSVGAVPDRKTSSNASCCPS